MLSMAMWMALLVAPIQAVGDMHGLNTLEHQPAKIAAIEGHWKTDPARPRRCCCLACRIWNRSARYGSRSPLGSLILTPSLHKQVPALKDFPKEDRPYSPAVFWSFRIMVGMGVLMIALGSAAPGCAIDGDCITASLSVACALYGACRPYCPGRRVGDYRDGPPAVGDLRLLRTGMRCRCTARCRWPSACWCLSWSARIWRGYYYIFRLIKKGP